MVHSLLNALCLFSDMEKVQVKIFRDTEFSELFILESVLPFIAVSKAKENVLIRGIGL